VNNPGFRLYKEALRGAGKTNNATHALLGISPDLRSQPCALDLTNTQWPIVSTTLYKAFAVSKARVTPLKTYGKNSDKSNR
jgi:hypothetical protein